MVDPDLDHGELAELVQNLAPGDQRDLLREVSASPSPDDPGEEPISLSDDSIGHIRRRFIEHRLTDDYEAVGERLTTALLSKAERELAEVDEPTDRLEIDVEVQIEPVGAPRDKLCVRFCMVSGILEPICRQACIVNGIYD